jgi:hypothetical protein
MVSAGRAVLNLDMVRVLGVLGSTAAAAWLVVSGAILISPAAAAPGRQPVAGAGDVDARQGAVRARITFTKRPAHPWRSRIAWDAWKQGADGRWTRVAHDSWRAGSGFPGRYTTDACAKNRGWLPDGSYTVRQYDDYHGSLIHGRAFRLSDKRCADGTVRQDLFVHTEAAAGNRQCADGPGDQLCRWEYPTINDYTSHGCIKLSPTAILALVRAYEQYLRPGVTYPRSKVHLLVR